MRVKLPDGTKIKSTHSGNLAIFSDLLPPAATRSFLFEELQQSLLSVPLLCDAGCTAIFSKNSVQISRNGITILEGMRLGSLWYADIPKNIVPTSNDKNLSHFLAKENSIFNILEIKNNKEKILFYQLILGSPTKKTLYDAARAGFLTSFPGLTPQHITRYYQLTDATAKGHLDLTRQNLRSTRPQVLKPSPTIPTSTERTIYICTYTMFTDMSGNFNHHTVTGDTAILLMYHDDLRYIHIGLCKGKSVAAYKEAYLNGLSVFYKAEANKKFKHKIEVIDNILSKELKKLFDELNITPQLVPPNNHRHNKAERMMRTAKNHIIALFASCHATFPKEALPHLIPQAEISLNLLRHSNIDPSKSAYEMVHGPFDFNKTPLAPPGCPVLVYDPPNIRASWAPHGTDGFYVGPAPNHYRCFTIYMPDTKRTRVSDTIAWLQSHKIIVPNIKAHLPMPMPNASNDPIFIATEPAAPASQIERVNPPAPTIERANPPAPLIERVNPLAPSDETAPHDEPQGNTINTDTLHPTPPPPPFVQPPTKSYMKLFQGSEKNGWEESMIEEIKRITIETGTMKHKPDGIVPKGRTASYVNPVGRVKAGVKRTRCSYGGNISDYTGNRFSSTVDITTVKCLLNSIISDPNSTHITIDIKDFFLCSTLEYPEYMWFPVRLIPKSYRHNFGAENMDESKSLLFEITKGLYGLPQAGRLAQKELVKHLESEGYIMSKTTPCLFHHISRPNIRFVLWVDDFLIKFSKLDKSDADHLIATLKKKYQIKIDWEGKQYLGMTIKRDRIKNTLNISMPGYIERMAKDLQLVKNKKITRSPIIYIPPKYSSTPQLEFIDDSPLLPPHQKKFIERVVGKLRYYAAAVDSPILLATNKIASQQANPTISTMTQINHLIQYVLYNPDASITYKPSNMQLTVHSDASHNSETKSRSRAAGLFVLGDAIFLGPENTNAIKNINGSIAINSTIIPTVCSSTMESEYAALAINTQTAEGIRQILNDLGHPQIQPTNIIYDNEISGKVALKKCKIKRSKAIASRYHWIQDRIRMGHFNLLWRPGKENLADFFTKAHPIHHHISMVPFFTHSTMQ